MAGPITALVLAAGRSRRMGETNKLLARIGGKAMVRKAVEAALASRAGNVVVVVGYQRAAIQAELAGLPVTIAVNAESDQGISTSLRAGLRAAPRDAMAFVVCLADMPKVTEEHIDSLIDAFDPDADRSICVSTHQGKRGNPVMWAGEFRSELEGLKGDAGARQLFGKYRDFVHPVAAPDAAVLLDVDTPAALAEVAGE